MPGPGRSPTTAGMPGTWGHGVLSSPSPSSGGFYPSINPELGGSRGRAVAVANLHPYGGFFAGIPRSPIVETGRRIGSALINVVSGYPGEATTRGHHVGTPGRTLMDQFLGAPFPGYGAEPRPSLPYSPRANKVFKNTKEVTKSFNQGIKNLSAGKKLTAKQQLIIGKTFINATKTSQGRAEIRASLFGATNNRNATTAQKKVAKQLIQAVRVVKAVQKGKAYITKNTKGQTVIRKIIVPRGR